MPGFGDLVQKAVYLGVGLASYAGEKASKTLAELRTEAQKLADEMVKRGEMTAEEARRFVDDALRQAQAVSTPNAPPKQHSEPRRIEILDEDDEPVQDSADQLRQRVKDLQEELRRMQQD
ncbi:MAG: hypothetical protein HC825_03720 [Oscillatoriales cyanobacterium RM1_1_9]|nr:hypothetical protein [Oscillatoriales cyanobacterium SM2_3_0]NJO47472.1 hypothetical protein [Oscillatoriales cyanobacterium RM2_1_1]NJO71041.1 hypothetical protein [Oscillatoriales cyanobacterium RM1_1_9]